MKLLLLAAGAIVSVCGSAAGQTEITRTVFGTGGGASASASMSVRYTVGEPLVGTVTSATMSVSAGFWLAPTEEACYPDCDPSTGPGVLDIFDFLCFQNRFAALDPYACDCDTSSGPGVCDIFDFLCFQNAYDAGCP